MAEYIEREALLAHLRECKETSTGSGLTAAVITAIQSFVEGMPLADVAPVAHGKWIEQEDPCGDPYYTCSACKDDFYIEMTGTVEKDLVLYSYCPSCGAKMDGEGEEKS